MSEAYTDHASITSDPAPFITEHAQPQLTSYPANSSHASQSAHHGQRRAVNEQAHQHTNEWDISASPLDSDAIELVVDDAFVADVLASASPRRALRACDRASYPPGECEAASSASSAVTEDHASLGAHNDALYTLADSSSPPNLTEE
jgi:hypothetical protein